MRQPVSLSESHEPAISRRVALSVVVVITIAVGASRMTTADADSSELGSAETLNHDLSYRTEEEVDPVPELTESIDEPPEHPASVLAGVPERTCDMGKQNDPERLAPAWRPDLDPATGLLRTLEIRTLSDEGLSYYLDGRVAFGALETSWTQGPYLLDASSIETVELTMPESIALHPKQSSFESTLVATVRVHRSEDHEVLAVESAPFATLHVDFASPADTTMSHPANGPGLHDSGPGSDDPDGVSLGAGPGSVGGVQ